MNTLSDSEQFDSELRDAIDAISLRIPEDVYERLRSHRYLSRRNRVRRTVLVAAPVAAAAAVVAVIVTGFGPAAQVAFAGWSATPTAPAPGQVSSAETTCLAMANRALQSTTNVQHKLLGTPEGSFQPVVIDTRGPYTLVVMSVKGTIGQENAACLTGPGKLAANPRLSTATGKATPPAAPDAVGTTGWGHTGTGTRLGADTVLLGTAGTTVTAVALTLKDGTSVTATVAHGMYAAWWPGSSNPLSAEARTATGKTTTHLFTPGADGPTPTDTTVKVTPVT